MSSNFSLHIYDFLLLFFQQFIELKSCNLIFFYEQKKMLQNHLQRERLQEEKKIFNFKLLQIYSKAAKLELEGEKNVRNKCDISSETGNKTFTSERISLYELHLMFKKQHDFEER